MNPALTHNRFGLAQSSTGVPARFQRAGVGCGVCAGIGAADYSNTLGPNVKPGTLKSVYQQWVDGAQGQAVVDIVRGYDSVGRWSSDKPKWKDAAKRALQNYAAFVENNQPLIAYRLQVLTDMARPGLPPEVAKGIEEELAYIDAYNAALVNGAKTVEEQKELFDDQDRSLIEKVVREAVKVAIEGVKAAIEALFGKPMASPLGMGLLIVGAVVLVLLLRRR